MGRTVGKDIFLTQQVALVGFEDIVCMNLTSPSFTCVSSASEETGRQVAALIIRKLKEPAMQPQKITLSGESDYTGICVVIPIRQRYSEFRYR